MKNITNKEDIPENYLVDDLSPVNRIGLYQG